MIKPWMQIELENAISKVLHDGLNKKEKSTIKEVIEAIVKQYKINIKRFKTKRKKWIDDNFEENAKILKQPPEY